MQQQLLRYYGNATGRIGHATKETQHVTVSFKYLGSLVTDLNEMEIKIKSRLAVGNKSYHALGPILKTGLYLSRLKFIYKTVTRPIVIYGAEAWTLI
jgi:hypothetical protein